LRLGTALLTAVMPGTVGKINAVLGYAPGAVWQNELAWDGRLTGLKVAEALVLFPRPEKPAVKK
jgi:methionyl-tRNA synthetase